MEGIENRLDEIQAMVKPKPELLAFLKEMGAGQSENMLAKMEAELLRKNRRNSRRYWQLLKHAFRMVYVISCLANSSRRYFYFDDPDAGPAVMRKQRIKYKAGRQQPIKSSMSSELQHVLMTNPDYRTEDQIKKILWLLRTTKAFLHLFLAEMSCQLARVLAYERLVPFYFQFFLFVVRVSEANIVTYTDKVGVSEANIVTYTDKVRVSEANIVTYTDKVRVSEANIVTYTDKVGVSEANIVTYTDKVGVSEANIVTYTDKVRVSEANIVTYTDKVGVSEANIVTYTDKVGVI
ncbi:uncharacterized protein LOC131950371 [Physella acuta]|uniref:uncharacterized protein LOC131950371 n=1 Tax=Physella acuta TaxID=109671 RepID=UPI0027DCCA86|nr:uncharacterized protein LOC131950371 [Physella acuta]